MTSRESGVWARVHLDGDVVRRYPAWARLVDSVLSSSSPRGRSAGKEVVGDCFRWALKNFDPKAHDVLVHAKVKPQGRRGAPYWHAWIERDGFVLDWQGQEVGQYPPIPVADFYTVYRPTSLRRYTRDSTPSPYQLMFKSKVWGPWP